MTIILDLLISIDFRYLRTITTKNENHEKAVTDKLAMGWAAVSKKDKVLKPKHISMSTKSKIVEAYVYPIVSCGMETITWTKHLLNKVNVFQNKIICYITNIRQI